MNVPVIILSLTIHILAPSLAFAAYQENADDQRNSAVAIDNEQQENSGAPALSEEQISEQTLVPMLALRAVRQNDVALLKNIFDNSKTPLDVLLPYGDSNETLLHIAVRVSMTTKDNDQDVSNRIIAYLLRLTPGAIHVLDTNGCTPLHYAYRYQADLIPPRKGCFGACCGQRIQFIKAHPTLCLLTTIASISLVINTRDGSGKLPSDYIPGHVELDMNPVDCIDYNTFNDFTRENQPAQ